MPLGGRIRDWRLTFNSNYHNTFERHHRFIGWLGIAV